MQTQKESPLKYVLGGVGILFGFRMHPKLCSEINSKYMKANVMKGSPIAGSCGWGFYGYYYGVIEDNRRGIEEVSHSFDKSYVYQAYNSGSLERECPDGIFKRFWMIHLSGKPYEPIAPCVPPSPTQQTPVQETPSPQNVPPTQNYTSYADLRNHQFKKPEVQKTDIQFDSIQYQVRGHNTHYKSCS